jgi:hypothetical protein
MLPIGSVGMVISKPKKDSDAKQALPRLTIISHASMRPRSGLAVGEKVGEGRVEEWSRCTAVSFEIRTSV